MITLEQFAEWKEHPVTKEVIRELKKAIKEIDSQILNGSTLGSDANETHGFTHRAIGQRDGLNQLLNISFEGESIDSNEQEVNEFSGY